MTKNDNISTLKELFNELFFLLQQTVQDKQDGLLGALISIFNHNDCVCANSFSPTDDAINSIVANLEKDITQNCPNFQQIKESFSYFIDEILCNIQQHSQAKNGYIHAKYNRQFKRIEVAIADNGISVYGSYVATQKYLEEIEGSDAQAIRLAKDGYSTKNLPNAENRGYGISSNQKMIVNGLNGEFAIYSGNALYIKTPEESKLLELPIELDFKGTIVVAFIPTSVPINYNFYDYIS